MPLREGWQLGCLDSGFDPGCDPFDLQVLLRHDDLTESCVFSFDYLADAVVANAIRGRSQVAAIGPKVVEQDVVGFNVNDLHFTSEDDARLELLVEDFSRCQLHVGLFACIAVADEFPLNLLDILVDGIHDGLLSGAWEFPTEYIIAK